MRVRIMALKKEQRKGRSLLLCSFCFPSLLDVSSGRAVNAAHLPHQLDELLCEHKLHILMEGVPLCTKRAIKTPISVLRS